MSSRSLLIVALALGLMPLLVTPAVADADPAARHVPEAALVGEGRLKFMLWNVFDARLEAPRGRYAADEPFALSLSYLRSLDADQIVDASIKEMSAGKTIDRQQLNAWRTALERVIPDVRKGTTITGVRDARGHARFYRDGEPLGQVEDEAFTKAFFDIWLGEESSRPALRDRLLSASAS